MSKSSAVKILLKSSALPLMVGAFAAFALYLPAASAEDAPASGFFNSAPLSGNVSLIDHVKPGGMRLTRATVPIDHDALAADDHKNRPANHHELPLTGNVEDRGTSLQSLFPSIDNTPPPTAAPTAPLTGKAGQDAIKAAAAEAKAHPHYIWEKSPLGGYYDASGNTQEVVRGENLYRYGGTMADGMTPAPSTPGGANSMGYIKWQPIHGGPAGWY